MAKTFFERFYPWCRAHGIAIEEGVERSQDQNRAVKMTDKVVERHFHGEFGLEAELVDAGVMNPITKAISDPRRMLNSDETPQPVDAPQKGRRQKVAKRKGKAVRKAGGRHRDGREATETQAEASHRPIATRCTVRAGLIQRSKRELDVVCSDHAAAAHVRLPVEARPLDVRTVARLPEVELAHEQLPLRDVADPLAPLRAGFDHDVRGKLLEVVLQEHVRRQERDELVRVAWGIGGHRQRRRRARTAAERDPLRAVVGVERLPPALWRLVRHVH